MNEIYKNVKIQIEDLYSTKKDKLKHTKNILINNNIPFLIIKTKEDYLEQILSFFYEYKNEKYINLYVYDEEGFCNYHIHKDFIIYNSKVLSCKRIIQNVFIPKFIKKEYFIKMFQAEL